MRQGIAALLERHLWPDGDRRDLWAVLDGARDRRVFRFLINSYLDYTCLYAGTLHPDLEIAAPYLVRLEQGDKYTNGLLEQAWGNSWGVLLRCPTTIESLRRHLRTFLVVRGPGGERLVFRYYDPRVLRVYLPTCFPDELRTVYGPIRTFWTEANGGNALHEFTWEQSALQVREIALEQT
jgi:hypothetical protein